MGGEGVGGYICVHSLSSSYMMKQKMTRNPLPFSVLFGSSSVITKHLKAVPETYRKITVYLNEL